jgi:cyclopropane-fatty-acyl-phospholipid synthase
MSNQRLEQRVKDLLNHANVRINGARPWDIQVHDERFYARVMAQGSLGLGESYMDGWWDCPELDQFFYHVLSAELEKEVRSWKEVLNLLKAQLVNLQSPSRSTKVGEHHYDMGNDLYEAMLDSRMIYSGAYWNGARNLDQAQEAKLDLLCQKLDLKPGMRLLDIGCGWGGTARYAAENYGVEVVGVTVSEEQVSFGQKLCQGLPVEIRYQDYRSIEETFDRVVSVGMFEHVGWKNYRGFMSKVKRLMPEDGLFVLQTIGRNTSAKGCDPWIVKYIFPNSMLPSASQICESAEGLFVLEDWHSFGPDYDKTLMAWFAQFHDSWEQLKNRYPQRFYRMWTYYLLSCAGSFRARKNQLWQIVLSPQGVQGGYRAPR